MSAALTTAPDIAHSIRELKGVTDTTRKRILVVDDDMGVLSALRRLFEVLDVDVDTCADPREAIARLEHGEVYDLVISDQRMPQMSGTEMLRKVRSTSPRTPTMLMSAYGGADEVDRAYETCGVFRYLTKPWNSLDLIVSVREALRAAEALEG